MKHTHTKRALSLLLAVLLVVGLVPVTALAEPASGPQLAEGSYAEWSDRLASSDYDGFRRWLSSTLLREPPSYTLLESGDYAYQLREYTGTQSFTYDVSAADADAAAAAAAEEAMNAAIAASGNDDLATVTAYATAIYSAYRMDSDAFYLSGDMEVGEVRSLQSEYADGAGTVSYTQRFYFYLSKADGSFDIRAEEYRTVTAINSTANTAEIATRTLLHTDFTNRTPYEMLVAANQWITEHNEYNTSADLTAIGTDCRSHIGALHGSTGANGPVCEGYARAFAHLAEAIGFETTLVTGLANGEPHMWLMIQMGDGNWYAVDPAWNDPVGGNAGAVSGLENSKYFLVGSDTVIDGVAFSESHVVTNVLTEGGLAFTNGPELSKDSYTVQSEDISVTTVYINGQDIKDIDAGDDTISWNEETKTLTLEGANILAENGTHKGAGIYVVGKDTVVLELKGDNTVQGQYDDETNKVFASAAISTVGSLVIRGDGTLTATELGGTGWAEYAAGIYSGGDLTIEGGTIHTSSDNTNHSSTGLLCGDNDSASTLTVAGGTVNATGVNNGAVVYFNIHLSGGTLNCTATGDNCDGIYTEDFLQTSWGRLTFSGGTLTTQGSRYALHCWLTVPNTYCWKDTADGKLQYTSLPLTYGEQVSYLHITPSDYGILQPSEDNQYSDEAQYRGDGDWGALPEDVTAEYQWYAVKDIPLTDQNTSVLSGDPTYDAASGLWTFPQEASIFAFEAEEGDIIVFTVHGTKPSVLYVITIEYDFFTEVSSGVFTWTVTEADIDPDTGLVTIAAFSGQSFQGSLLLQEMEEVQTKADIPSRFVSDTAGSYTGKVTLSKDGEPFAVLRTNSFDYTYTGWKNVYGDGGVVLGTQYLYRHEVQYTGWTEIDGEWYYLDPTTGYRAQGVTRVPYPTASINGNTYAPNAEDVAYYENKGQTFIDKDTALFVFDENGVFQSDLNGLTDDDRWAVNGHIAWHVGLVQVGEDYYYFIGDEVNGGNVLATGDVYASRNTTDFDMVVGGVYTFDSEGKLCRYDGITEVGGVLRYYENYRLMLGNGLTKVGENYIYVGSDGTLIVNGDYYVPENDLGIAAGNYHFDENGYLFDHVDADGSGRCDVCNALMQPAKFSMASVSLKGNIAINYYMLLSDEVLADETAYMQFTMADGEIRQISVSEGVKREYNGETYYVFTCTVAAKEMTDDIISQFFYAGGSTAAYTYNVRTYAKNIIANYDDEATRDLMTAMLNYGAASQLHFDYNTDRLANAGLETPDYSDVTVEGFTAAAGQGTELAKFYSASLILKSETTLRFFFQADSSATFTVTYNGQELEVNQRGGLYYVDVVGISAKDLDGDVTITINDGTNTAEVSFDPMAYCQGVLNDTTGSFSAEMKDLVRALYLYNQAANAYFEEN